MEDKQLTNRVAIWIGAKLGCVLMLMAFILILVMVMTNDSFLIQNVISLVIGLPIAFIGPGILFGIAGASIGRYWRKTRLATETGAVIGTVLGIATIGLFLGMLG